MDDPCVQDLIATRGFVNLISADIKTRRAAGNSESHKIDLSVYEMLEKRRNDQPCGARAWEELVMEAYGELAAQDLASMAAGDVLHVAAPFFGSKHNNTKVEQATLDYGLDVESFDRRIVSGLKDGSRAAAAGLRNGDRVVWNSYLWQCAGDYDRKMEVVVDRVGEHVRIERWPRTYQKVESWQVLPIA
ncbi:MAG: hypothetical protein M1818_001187 [Claussenomyces sp. TS43310]|nr:MAG: hypothetical protein M1818_001187 [Claussenomyces sp. TS43310]